MNSSRFNSLAVCVLAGLFGCQVSGVPEPIRVLENPETGERVRMYREIAYKVPADYDEEVHIAEWKESQRTEGFTVEISPEDDRERLAEERARNLEAARQQNSN